MINDFIDKVQITLGTDPSLFYGYRINFIEGDHFYKEGSAPDRNNEFSIEITNKLIEIDPRNYYGFPNNIDHFHMKFNIFSLSLDESARPIYILTPTPTPDVESIEISGKLLNHNDLNIEFMEINEYSRELTNETDIKFLEFQKNVTMRLYLHSQNKINRI